MADSSEPTSAAPAPDPRRMQELRRLALLSILLLGPSLAFPAFSPLPALVWPFWLPYLMLWRRSPEGQKRALGWAVVAGVAAFSLSTATLLLAGTPPIVKDPLVIYDPAPQAGDYVALFASLLFVPTQAAMAWSAIKTFNAARRQPGEKLRVGLPVACVFPVWFFFLTLLLLPNPDSGMRVEKNEASATSTLRTLNTAQATYAASYEAGFTSTLTKLGAPTIGQPDASHADLVDPVLSGRASGGTAISFRKGGYRFVYTAGAPDADGRIRTYVITARPERYQVSGVRSFFTDQTDVIRATSEDRGATARDPAL